MARMIAPQKPGVPGVVDLDLGLKRGNGHFAQFHSAGGSGNLSA
jgi:hypothetical protein